MTNTDELVEKGTAALINEYREIWPGRWPSKSDAQRLVRAIYDSAGLLDGTNMLIPNLPERLWQRHQEFYRLGSKDLGAPGTCDDIRFLALALAGEAGELANVIKKQWRDGGVMGEYYDDLAGEIADVLSYTFILAKSLDIDPIEAMEAKFEVVNQRIAERASSIPTPEKTDG